MRDLPITSSMRNLSLFDPPARIPNQSHSKLARKCPWRRSWLHWLCDYRRFQGPLASPHLDGSVSARRQSFQGSLKVNRCNALTLFSACLLLLVSLPITPAAFSHSITSAVTASQVTILRCRRKRLTVGFDVCFVLSIYATFRFQSEI